MISVAQTDAQRSRATSSLGLNSLTSFFPNVSDKQPTLN